MMWILDVDGGFIVRSDLGNYAYAYPTSIHANKATTRPEAIAKEMAREADRTAHYAIVPVYNERMAQKYEEADKRIHAVLP